MNGYVIYQEEEGMNAKTNRRLSIYILRWGNYGRKLVGKVEDFLGARG